MKLAKFTLTESFDQCKSVLKMGLICTNRKENIFGLFNEIESGRSKGLKLGGPRISVLYRSGRAIYERPCILIDDRSLLLDLTIKSVSLGFLFRQET